MRTALKSWCSSVGWLHIVLRSTLAKYARVSHNWQVLVRTGVCRGEACGRRSETTLCWSQPFPAVSTTDKTDPPHVSTWSIREAHDTSVKTYFRRGGHYYWQDAQGEIQEDTWKNAREKTQEKVHLQGDCSLWKNRCWTRGKERETKSWKKKKRKPLQTDPNLLWLPSPHRWD